MNDDLIKIDIKRFSQNTIVIFYERTAARYLRGEKKNGRNDLVIDKLSHVLLLLFIHITESVIISMLVKR